MSRIPIGIAGAGVVTLDLDRLVSTRALIQANSGGGKSWLLRLIAEQSAGVVQTIVFDPEGEFRSLRQIHDLAIVGPRGDAPASADNGGVIAAGVARSRASAVLDLSDLKIEERREFARAFIEHLMSLPRSAWRPMLVMIDEAHLFAPERSPGKKAPSATQAIIDLMSLGRKRGFCGILATQRLSKLHKDAAAECSNLFIGRTVLDLDQRRAADALGLAKADRQSLRDLPAGTWKAFGPALCSDRIIQFAAGQVRTHHPAPGQPQTMGRGEGSRGAGLSIVWGGIARVFKSVLSS